MNILFVTEDHSTENFGVTTVVSQLADQLASRVEGLRLVVAANGSNAVPQREAVVVRLIPITPFPNPWRWSPGLAQKLSQIVDQYEIDLIHLHGVWMAAQWAGLMTAKKRNLPCILTSHGMLQPWFLNDRGIVRRYKKSIYLRAVLRPAFSKQTVLHAITQLEREQFQRLFPRQRIVVIPNAFGESDSTREAGMGAHPEKYFLFLGRLHPIKGVDLLIEAFAQAGLGEEWRLIIAGPEEIPSFAAHLRSSVSAKGLTRRIQFMPPVFGDAKWDLMSRAWTLAAPSYSEVMSMVNLEGAACGVPSITTHETGLWDWEKGGGLLIHPTIDELAMALRSAASWSVEERNERGCRSHQLLTSRYSWDEVIPQWKQLYEELIGK